MNKELRRTFTDEERADPALEKLLKAEKAAARAEEAQANIPKKGVMQTVIDPDTGKKTSKLTFEDKKNHPPKFLKGSRKHPSIWSQASLHKEYSGNRTGQCGRGKRPQVRGGGGDRRLSGAGGRP